MSGQWWNDDDLEGGSAAQPPTPPPSAGGYTPPTPPPQQPPPAAPGDVDQPTYGSSVPPGPSSGGGGRGAGGVPWVVAIAAVIALIGGLLVYNSLNGGDDDGVVVAGEIFLERADEAGDDPFFDDYNTLVSFDSSQVSPPGVEVSGGAESVPPEQVATPDPLTNAEILALSFKGGEPGLYGGTGNLATCNKAALIAFLETTPDKAAAWAGAQGIPVSEIRPFVEGLTTVALLADTRVTNHGFKNGVANPIQSVLQAGMAVMIDDTGIPRVKCGCGNPLNRPIAQSRTVVLKGDPWVGFDQDMVATVEPAPDPVDTFVLRSTDTGVGVERPAGTDGEADTLTGEPAPRPTDDLVSVGAAAGVSDSLTEGSTVVDPGPTTTATTVVPETSPPETSPLSTLAGDTYCEKYESYIVEGLERFRDLDFEEGTAEYNRLEAEWLEFLLVAIADLSFSSPSEVKDDWVILGEEYGRVSAARAFDLYGEMPRVAAAEDAIVSHGEDVCGLDF